MSSGLEIEQAWRVLEGGERESEVARLRAVRVAATSIGMRGDRGYVRLQGLLTRLGPAVRRSAERYLHEARRNSARWEVLSRTAAHEDPRVRRGLVKLSDRLRADEPYERLIAARQAAAEADFTAAPALATRVVVERDPEVRAELSRTLGLLGGTASMPVMKRASRDDVAEVRLAAVEGLGHQLGEEAVRLLLERTADPDRAVRRRARELIATHDPDQVLTLLEAIPDGRGTGLVRGVLQAIQRWMGDPRVDRVMARMAGWSRPEVAQVAREAIRREEEKEATNPPRPRPYLSLP